jgi:dihydroorotate dehydrogenase (NAD+) catalytic subunit
MPAASLPDPASPDLTARLGPNLTLSGPVLAASGTFGYGEEIADLADCGSLGALITPTLTLQARRGNPIPRTAEASAGLLHAIGLPNPGLEAFLTTHLPRLCALPCPVIVSIAAETPAEWSHLAQQLSASPGVAALELNLTPFPLLLTERAADPHPSEATLLTALSAATAAARTVSALPLIAKLPAVGAETAAAARAVVDAGADAISVSQAFPGVAVRLSSRKFRFPGVVGGLSGPCIKPLALYQVWRAAQAVSVPILGAGGIMTGEDALEFLLAGASLLAVGTASFIHPNAIARITTEIAAYLQTHRIASMQELIGSAR